MSAAEKSGDARPTVLAILGCFSRGVEATGPNQSMIGMAEALGHRYRFRVIGEAAEGDIPGRWTTVAGIEQLPLVVGPLGARGLRRAIASTPHDLVISNSIFDGQFSVPTLGYRRFGLIPRRPMLLAPRGELDPGALRLGRGRKAAHLTLVKLLGLLRNGVAMQATSEIEAANIRAALGEDVPVYVTPNIRSLGPLPPHEPRPPGAPLRIAFLSRIDRKKNLDYALERIAEAGVPVQFSICGPVSNESYGERCRSLVQRMPPHVEVIYRGNIPNRDVPAALAAQDLFILPTLGENYGHSIMDSLAAGTPVLISDRTPWRGLADRGVGWDLPLEAPDAFVAAIRSAAVAGIDAQKAQRRAVRCYAEEKSSTGADAAKLAAAIDELIGFAGAVQH